MLKDFKMTGMKCVVIENRTDKEARKKPSNMPYDSETYSRHLVYDDGEHFITISKVNRSNKPYYSIRDAVTMWSHKQYSYKLVEYTATSNTGYKFSTTRIPIFTFAGRQHYIYAGKHTATSELTTTYEEHAPEPTMELTFKVNGETQKPTSISKETWLKLGGFSD